MTRNEPAPRHEIAPQRGLSSLSLVGLFLLVCGVLAVEARQPLWFQHLQGDLGEFVIRAEKYRNGTIEGTEYPPFAVLFFVLVRNVELAFHVGFVDLFFFANHALIALHLAFLNQVAGRLAAILFAVLMLAAGPIVLFRFELLVSFLLGVAWYAWQRRAPFLTGAILSAAILSKLYPLVLLPLFARKPRAEDDVGRHVGLLGAGLAAGLALILGVFALGGGPLGMMSGLVSFHGQKPIALESTPAVIAMGFDHLRGAWPSRSVNEWGIHGLPLPGGIHRLTQLALVLSLAALLLLYWRRGARLVPVATAMLWAVVFWTPLFQPQYQLWPLVFLVLLSAAGVPAARAVGMAVLAALSLAAEQFVYPTHYTEFLAIFYQQAPAGALMLAVVTSKLAIAALFVLSVRESLASTKP